VAIAAVISPYRNSRNAVRARIPNFIEIHMDCPLSVLVERDVKGLYKKAMAGEIQNFTGISDPYEPPESPDVRVDSSTETIEESVGKVMRLLDALGLLQPTSFSRALKEGPEQSDHHSGSIS
jgi:adenylylsulfate kinase